MDCFGDAGRENFHIREGNTLGEAVAGLERHVELNWDGRSGNGSDETLMQLRSPWYCLYNCAGLVHTTQRAYGVNSFCPPNCTCPVCIQ